jgi:hypothetical protein
MKTHKLTKIFGIGLSLILLVSMLAIAAPVTAKDPGAQQWANGSEPGPSAVVMYNGGDVTDFAVGSDGVAYLVDDVKNRTRRSSSGTVWGSIDNHAAGDEALVAVAPDNSDCVALVDGTTNVVYISNDSGTTWSTLPALAGNYATSTVMDIAVGPARSGTLLGREYFLAVADGTLGATNTATAFGGVLVIGQTAAWAEVVTGLTEDFIAVELSPNYVGDRVVTAVGVTALGAKNFYLMNASTNAELTNSPITFVAAVVNDDYDGATATSAACAGIAMASDFDPTDANAYRAWVSFGSIGGLATDDVSRFPRPECRNRHSEG